MTTFETYRDLTKYLCEDYVSKPIPLYTGEDGLLTAEELFRRLGSPHLGRQFLHIAATSGKGTVAYMVNTLLSNQGKTIGLHVSPHVYDIRERFQINGNLITKKDVLRISNEVLAVVDIMANEGYQVGYFLLMLAISLKVFQESKCDLVILETGMGGLLDFTNLVEPSDKICVLGQIGLDHTKVLGETVEEISYHKAGIIQRGNAVFALYQTEEVNKVFDKIALQKRAFITWCRPTDLENEFIQYLDDNICLMGSHQKSNLSLAVAVSAHLKSLWGSKNQMEKSQIAKLHMPGRFEIVKFGDKTIIFDGAHNIQKIEALIDSFKSNFNSTRCGLIYATNHVDEFREQLTKLDEISAEVVLTQYPILQETTYKSAVDFSLLSNLEHYNILNDLGDVAEHVDKSKIMLWLVTGSFYLIESCKKAFEVRFIS